MNRFAKTRTKQRDTGNESTRKTRKKKKEKKTRLQKRRVRGSGRRSKCGEYCGFKWNAMEREKQSPHAKPREGCFLPPNHYADQIRPAIALLHTTTHQSTFTQRIRSVVNAVKCCQKDNTKKPPRSFCARSCFPPSIPLIDLPPQTQETTTPLLPSRLHSVQKSKEKKKKKLERS